jgi:hypothetical protein
MRREKAMANRQCPRTRRCRENQLRALWTPPHSPLRVLALSLSHRMGEDRGEGKEAPVSSCRFNTSRVPPRLCQRREPGNCADDPHGLRKNCGNCFDHDAWPDTNFDVKRSRDDSTWTFIASKQNWPSKLMVRAMVSLLNRNTIRNGMHYLQRVESCLSESGIIDWLAHRIGKTWSRTFGNCCRSALHIRETFRHRLIGESRTSLRWEDPHPDPLPSDGRGNSQRTRSEVLGTARIFERVLQFSLSHRMGEGRGEGL